VMHMRSGALGRCSGVPWLHHRSSQLLATSSPAPARRLRRLSARGQSVPEAPPPTRRVQVSCCGCLCFMFHARACCYQGFEGSVSQPAARGAERSAVGACSRWMWATPWRPSRCRCSRRAAGC